ncbi:MAG: FeoB-associated Cys-rich membrane protein [Clostridium sp.]
MLTNIIVGLVFASILVFAFKKAYSDAKNNKCSCGSSCSDKSKCNKR